MNISVRRKLDMARRVRDFCRTHPSQNQGHIAAVARLEERLARAEALAQQQISGQQTVSGAIANKEELRMEIHKTIALLAGLAKPAAKEEPELAAGILRPDVNGSHLAFLTRSRVAAATASAHQDLLVKYGMPEGFLEELDAALDHYEQALNQQHAGRATHVGATAELEAVTADLMLTIRQIDALNRFHFRQNTESLHAWKSARDVAWPITGEKPEKPAA
jgi:hypothetical protein